MYIHLSQVLLYAVQDAQPLNTEFGAREEGGGGEGGYLAQRGRKEGADTQARERECVSVCNWWLQPGEMPWVASVAVEGGS